MSVRFSIQSGNFQLNNTESIKKWISEVVKGRGGVVGNINYLFCDDDYLLDVNLRYLNHDTYTDIITFDYVVASFISGDIFISVDRVRENATIFGVEFQRELLRVIIHGVLHLLGQGDKSDAEAAEMRHQEEEALAVWDKLFHEERIV